MTKPFPLPGECLMKDKLTLSRSFHTNATLITNIGSVKKDMEKLKGFKLLEENAALKYKITTSNDCNDSLIELACNHISLTFFSESNNHAVYKDNFTAFISLVAFLKEHYEIHLDSIYGYIMDILDNEWRGISKDQSHLIGSLKERIKSLDESNRILSYALIDSSRANIQVGRERTVYAEFSKCIIGNLNSRGKSKSDDHSILLSLGVDQQLVKKVESILEVTNG